MKVSVIGLGKLGTPLAAVLSSKGHKVIGLDLSGETVQKVNLNEAPVEETGLQALMDRYPFRATVSYPEAVARSEVSFVIVPTPSGPDGQFSSEHVISAVTKIGEALRYREKYHLVVVCSTVMPGETDGPIRRALEEASGRTDIGLCYSPEFIALGSVIHDMLNPDMVLIGESDEKAGSTLAKLMRTLSEAPIKRMSIVDAEVSKISVNAYITMKISYANTLAEICEKIPGADARVVAQAVGADTRIGSKYLLPATAYGGPCFPRDTKAFAAFARALSTSAPLAVASDEINDRQTERLVELAHRYAKDKNATVLGLAYKPYTKVTERSPGVRLAERLLEEDFTVWVYDPAVITGSVPLPVRHSTGALSALRNSSVGFIMTPWPEFENVIPLEHEIVIVDCWNVTEEGPWDELYVHRIGRG